MNAENPVQIDLFGVSATRTKDTRLAEHIGGSVRGYHADPPVVRPAWRAHLRISAQACALHVYALADRTEDFLFCRVDDDMGIICDQNSGQLQASSSSGPISRNHASWVASASLCPERTLKHSHDSARHSKAPTERSLLCMPSEGLPLTGHVLDHGIHLLPNLPWVPRRAQRHSGRTERTASSAEPKRTSATPMLPRPIATRELGELSDDE
jgi:hypothetical protein